MVEEGAVKVFGMSLHGYFRYFLKQEQQGLFLILDRLPSSGMVVSFSGLAEKFHAGAKIALSTKKPQPFSPSLERLSLGVNKALDMSKIKRRQDLKELLPLWLAVGFKIPTVDCAGGQGFAEMALCQLEQSIARGDSSEALKLLKVLYLAGFEGIFTPRMVDEEYQGITSDALFTSKGSSLQLLSRSAAAIRSLFFQGNKEGVSLLPCLPKGFVSGVYKGVVNPSGHTIDMAWSKGYLRMAVITPSCPGSLQLSLQKNIKSFRVRKSLKDRGSFIKAGDSVDFSCIHPLFLDRFET
jgi:hypothetical protein